jgi:hypothetical protein
MSQNTTKNKNINNDRPAKVITSPDGTEIQITAGRKLQAIRSFARDPDITDAQFRALVCIVDRLNEGQGSDESRWGSAYPKFETLAQDIAKDERAAKRIVKELETGQRQTRSGMVTTLVPCKSVLTVQRSKDEDERNNVNLYRLKEWGAFAIDQSGEGAVTCKERCGHLQEGVRSPVREGAVTAPDSTHLLTSETHLTDPPQLAPASGERGPADGLDDRHLEQEDHRSRETSQARASNDNQPVDDHSRSKEQPVPSYSPTFEGFWNAYPRKLEKDKPAAYSQWLEIKQAGGVTSDQIMCGLSVYKRAKREGDPNHVMFPVRWLKERRWTEFAAMPSGSNRRQTMAI